MTLVNFTDDDLATLRHQLFKTQQQVDNLQAHIASLTPTGGPARAVIVGVASGEIPAASGQTYGKGDMKVYPLYADGRARVDAREQEVYNPSAIAIDDGEKVVAWKETWGRLWVVRPVDGEGEEWTVAELEAETAVTHDAAVTYDTAAGNFQIEAAADVILNPTNDVFLKANNTTFIQIDKSEGALIFGAGAHLTYYPSQGRFVWAQGVRGIPHWEEVEIGFASFQDAAQTKTVDTGINLKQGAVLLAAHINVTTLFDDAVGISAYDMDIGQDSNNADTQEINAGLDVSGNTGTAGIQTGDATDNPAGGTDMPRTNATDDDWDLTLTLTTDNLSLLLLNQGVVTSRFLICEP